MDLEYIEEFCRHYQYTISALGVIATFMAIGLSLWLATRDNKPRILATIDFGNMSAEPEFCLRLVWVTVTNRADTPVSLHYDAFKCDGEFSGVLDSRPGLEFCDYTPHATHITGVDHDLKGHGFSGPILAVSKNYPVLVSPGEIQCFYLFEEALFMKGIKDAIAKSKIKQLLRFFGIIPYPKIDIILYGKFKIRAKYPREVKKRIISDFLS